MPAVSECDVIWGRSNELVLDRRHVLLLLPEIAERIEYHRIIVVVFVEMRCEGRCDESRAFRDERPVVERDVLDHLAREPDCIVQAVKSTYAR